jgi:fermentation-respiration switch protein FrsA (DUF1100 family)
MKHTKQITAPHQQERGNSRRLVSVVKLGIAAAALAILPLSPAVADQRTANNGSTEARSEAIKPKSVSFMNGDIKMAGHLYLPHGFKARDRYPAIVVVHPAGGVKEQTAGLYARNMAEQGFVALAYDASHQGESGGQPRFLEDPASRVEDIRSAVDYLTTLAYVDPNRIGGLGICAGSGYTIKAATLDRRIKAAATVSAFDMGAGFRKGWEGTAPVSAQIATLEAVAAQRSAEARGAKPKYVEYVPEIVDSTTHRDMREAHEYYRKSANRHPNSPNKMLFTSIDKIFGFTAFDQVDTLLTQPLLVIAGSAAGSLWHSRELHAKAKGQKELFIIDGATHMDLYAGEHVEPAVNKLSPFFKRNL